MKLLKKGAALLVSLVMVLSLLPTFTFAQATETNLNLQASASTVEVGDTFTVTVSTKEMTVNSFTGGISFNSNVVKVESWTGGTGSSRVFLTTNVDGEVEKVTVTAGVGDSGTDFGMLLAGVEEVTYYAQNPLVTLTFKALAPGDAGISLYEHSDGPDGFQANIIDAGFSIKVEDPDTPQADYLTYNGTVIPNAVIAGCLDENGDAKLTDVLEAASITPSGGCFYKFESSDGYTAILDADLLEYMLLFDNNNDPEVYSWRNSLTEEGVEAAGYTGGFYQVTGLTTITTGDHEYGEDHICANPISTGKNKTEPCGAEDPDAPADYTAVDAALAKVPEDLSIYTDETAKAIEDAVAAVDRTKKIDEQAAVEAMAQAIEDAVAALEKKPADYDAVDAALDKVPEDLSIYTDETAKAIEDAVAAVDRTKKIDEQAAVDAMAEAIEDAVAALELKPADYTAVDDAIAAADALNKDLFTEDSLKKLEEAIAAVDRTKMADEQAAVDTMAQAIEDAVAALEKKPADYTAVDEAIAAANALDKDLFTEDSVKKLEEAIATVDRTKKIDEQDEVEEMANAIKEAMEGLREKPLAYSFESTGAEAMTYTEGSASSFKFTVHRSYHDSETIDHYLRIEVDQVSVDPSNAIVESGSLKVSLKAEYMATLSEGKHTLKVFFDDGVAETTFTIAKKTDDNTKADDSTKTGDANNMILWIVLMAMALAGGATGVVLFKRKGSKR